MELTYTSFQLLVTEPKSIVLFVAGVKPTLIAVPPAAKLDKLVVAPLVEIAFHDVPV